MGDNELVELYLCRDEAAVLYTSENHISLNYCRNRSRLKRSAFICELSTEMEQCIPAPDDVESRVDDMVFSEAISGFLGTLGEEKRNTTVCSASRKMVISVVVVSFTGDINVEEGNVVEGAYSLARGYLSEDGISVPE